MYEKRLRQQINEIIGIWIQQPVIIFKQQMMKYGKCFVKIYRYYPYQRCENDIRNNAGEDEKFA